MAAKTDTGATTNSPQRREGWSRKEQGEREIRAEENDEKDLKSWSARQKQAEANTPLEKHEQPARHTDNRHKGDQNTDRNLETAKADHKPSQP